MEQTPLSLEEQLQEFRQRKFLAMPIAGTLAWAAIGVCGMFFDTLFAKSMSIFCGTGVIFYLALLVAKFTNEDLLGRNRPKNVFDNYFLLTVAQAVAVYSIAIPYFLVDKTSLPLSVGILTGLMWLPFSGFVGHWIGLFHTSARTVLVLVLWYLLPELRFVAIPFAIVGVYAITIAVLLQRHHSLSLSE